MSGDWSRQKLGSDYPCRKEVSTGNEETVATPQEEDDLDDPDRPCIHTHTHILYTRILEFGATVL